MLSAAKILKSNGTEGDILIGFVNADIEDFKTTEPVFVEFDGLPVPFFIDSITPKGASRAIVHFDGVECLRDAEELCGKFICFDSADDDSSEDEDFTGWTLYDRERLVGIVDGLEDIPGNPCLSVAGVLVPLHEDLILSADPGTRTIVFDLPEGLV